MSEYRCISCGAVKEYTNPCNCPVCGYRMFEMPYERYEILINQIKSFLLHLRLNEVPFEMLKIYRKDLDESGNGFCVITKAEDDGRFPDFNRIQGYVCSAAKTEIFCERLHKSLDEIRKHFHEQYSRKYTVELNEAKGAIEARDSVLRDALSELKISYEPPAVEFPTIELLYTEKTNEHLIGIADKLLDNLVLLSEKIKRFIKQNNIYGTAYQRKHNGSIKLSESEDYYEVLCRCSTKVESVLSKRYIVDILSDGSNELDEMLKTLWNAVKVIMTAPLLEKNYSFHFSDGIVVDDKGIERELLNRVNDRYKCLEDIVCAYDFLRDKTEDELFSIYDNLIEFDTFGIMGVDKSGLLKIGESEKKLNELIGLIGIKESIKKIKAYALSNKDSDDLNIHMCFLGNPGSGKTEVARYIAGILYENKILPTNKVVEVDRSGLVSQYFGATSEKTSQVIASAMGGVLFIDEAYALGNNSDHGIADYGKEAIDTLVKAMEDYRGKFCVIFAGYKNETLRMLSTNPGLKSRIQFTLDFPNYSRDELRSIAEMMLRSRHYTMAESAMNRMLDITDIKRKEANFANAREIRNILDQIIMCQNVRCIGTDNKELGLADVNKYIQDAKINLPTSSDEFNKAVLTGEEELDKLIGLTSVKRMIKKIKAYAKRNKGDPDFNMHMCFYGNPGTGKTEVARILSRILYDAGVLNEAKLVEIDGQGLIGKYVGETAPKTEAKINDAMNGVLFIDEAYSLAGTNPPNGASNSYGEEAIAVLLKAMEDYRGRFCVILAGYKEEMTKLLSANPGFESRIQFQIEFPDYTREELSEIALSFIKEKKYEIDDKAMNLLLDVTEYYRKKPNFANARTVRSLVEQVIMNQNLRCEDKEGDYLIVKSDVDDYIKDEGLDLTSSATFRKIGF